MILHGLVVSFRLPDHDRELEYMPPVLFTSTKALVENQEKILEVFQASYDGAPEVIETYEQLVNVIE